MRKMIRIYHAFVLLLYVLLLLSFGANGIISILLSLLLGVVGLVYVALSAPMYFVKKKMLSFLLVVNSLVIVFFPIAGFNPYLFISKEVLYFLVGMVMIVQVILFFLFDNRVAEIVKQIRKIDYRSGLSTNVWIGRCSKMGHVITTFSLGIYHLTSTKNLLLLFILKIIVDVVMSISLFRIFGKTIVLRNYMVRLLAVYSLFMLILLFILVVRENHYVFVALFLFSNFMLPLVKQKEFEFVHRDQIHELFSQR